MVNLQFPEFPPKRWRRRGLVGDSVGDFIRIVAFILLGVIGGGGEVIGCTLAKTGDGAAGRISHIHSILITPTVITVVHFIAGNVGSDAFCPGKANLGSTSQ